MSAFETNIATWRFTAIGKHPVAKDFFRIGEAMPYIDELSDWIAAGYKKIMPNRSASPEFCSWRFWLNMSRSQLVCGVIRDSSDSIGRPYPVLIIGSGLAKGWEENWDFLPFAFENTWRQIEYLVTQNFDDLKILDAEICNIKPPTFDWPQLEATRNGLSDTDSPLNPYAAFLDFKELKNLARSMADKSEIHVGLDRETCVDRIIPVSMWHYLFKETTNSAPYAFFVGGTLEKSYLVTYRRKLSSADFIRLWSVSSAG
jgi:type VI secretion system protein VasJ